MARAQQGGPGAERRRRRGGLCSSRGLEKLEGGQGRLPGPSPYLGAVVATFSPAEWQLVPLGCWLAEPEAGLKLRGRECGRTARACSGSGTLPGTQAPHTHTHSGQDGGHLPGNPELPPLHGEGQPLLRWLTQYYRPPHPGSHPSPPRAPECPYSPSPNPQGKSLPRRGGQARLGVGLWRPGPGTQRRKFQAVTPGCLQGGLSDQQRIQHCGFLHLAPLLLASGYLALQLASAPALRVRE